MVINSRHRTFFFHTSSKTFVKHLMTKPTKWHVRPAKTRISLGIRPVWSVIAVRMQKTWVLCYQLSHTSLLGEQRRLWSDCADVQADLSLRWAHILFVVFVMRWPMCFPLVRFILFILADWLGRVGVKTILSLYTHINMTYISSLRHIPGCLTLMFDWKTYWKNTECYQNNFRRSIINVNKQTAMAWQSRVISGAILIAFVHSLMSVFKIQLFL